MNIANDSLRKAAILVSSLDQETANTIMAQIPQDQNLRVRHAIHILGSVSDNERRDIIDDFLQITPPMPTSADDGIELDDSLALHFSQSPQHKIGQSVDNSQKKPFHFLCEMATESLAPLLAGEHPQTTAIILAYLPPEQAAELVLQFTPDHQVNVLRRLADINFTDPQIIREIEEVLESLLSVSNTTHRKSDGITSVNNILEAIDTTERQHLLETLANHDRNFAARFQQTYKNHTKTNKSDMAMLQFPNHLEKPSATSSLNPMENQPHERLTPLVETPSTPAFTYEQLSDLDDSALSAVLCQANPEVTLLALAGSHESFVDRILSQLSKRDAKQLRRKIDHLGPLRLRDIETAQHQLAQIAERLIEDHPIHLLPTRGLSVAT